MFNIFKVGYILGSIHFVLTTLLLVVATGHFPIDLDTGFFIVFMLDIFLLGSIYYLILQKKLIKKIGREFYLIECILLLICLIGLGLIIKYLYSVEKIREEFYIYLVTFFCCAFTLINILFQMQQTKN